MSVRVLELAGAELDYDPRTPGARIPYFAWGSDVEPELRQAVLAACPAAFGGMPLRRVDVREDGAPGFWRCAAVYAMADAQVGINPLAPSPPPPPGVPAPPAPPPPPTDASVVPTNYAFQWAMPTGRFTQSKKTVEVNHPAGVVPPDFKGAIGVQPDGSVEGVDLPGWPEAITLTAAVPQFTLGYYKLCRRLAGRTNDAPFLGQPAGEVLYLGGSAQPREGGGFTVSHRFAQAEDQVLYGGELAPDFPGFAVPAFHYLWVWYSPKAVDGRTVQVPTAAFTERLYDPGNFSSLGLFT